MTVPPIIASPPTQAHVPLFTLPWEATLILNGGLYGVSYPITGGDLNTYLDIWWTPWDMAEYQTFLIASNAKIASMCYDATQNKVYMGPTYTSISPRLANVFQFDPVTQKVTPVVNGTSTGLGGPSTSTRSCICSDGSFIYATMQTNVGTNAWLFKFRISDGTLVASIQMTDLPGHSGSGYAASQIQLLNPTTLVVASRGASIPWLALVPTDLSTITTMVQPIEGLTFMYVDEGNVWAGGGSTGTVYEYDGSLSQVAALTFDAPNPVSGMYYDEAHGMWAVSQGNTICSIDVDSATITAIYRNFQAFADPTNSNFMHMVWPTPAGISATDFINAANATSFGYFLPFGDTSAKPPLHGRGAC